VDDVVRIAAEISEKESSILTFALGTATLAEARERYGYHVLQRREADA